MIPFGKTLDGGIRRIALARAVRYAGWGFGETMLSVFMMGFAVSYGGAGFFSAVLAVSAILTLPIAGYLVDRMSAQTMVLFSLLVLYPLVGLGYFLAGACGSVAFLIFARFLNGISWPLDSVGVDTYYRRMASSDLVAHSFGFIDTFANLGWIIAGIIGMFLVEFIPIHVLLFAVAPTSVLAWWIVRGAPKDHPGTTSVYIKTPPPPRSHIKHRNPLVPYREALNQIVTFGHDLQFVVILTFFTSLLTAFTSFFLPIVAYQEGASLSLVAFLAILTAVPPLFGYLFGMLVENRDPYRVLATGLAVATGAFILVALSPLFTLKVLVVLIVGGVVELFTVAQRSIVTRLGDGAHIGQTGSVFTSVNEIGALVGPMLIGLGMDIAGFSLVAVVAAVLSGGFALLCLWLTRTRTLAPLAAVPALGEDRV